MRQNQPLVSVNLLTYNAEEYIKPCLGSVLIQTYPLIEILIIDNASWDKTIEILNLQVCKFSLNSRIRVILNRQNIGFAAGHNQGIRESRGEFVLCLNQDMVLDKDFIKKAVEIFDKDKKIAAVQGKLYRFTSSSANIIDTTGLVMLKNRRIIGRGQGQSDGGRYKNIEEIFGVDGAAPIYRRKALEDVKIKGEYFDQDFFMYKEDVDLAWRLRLYGWRSFYQPDAIAWHARGAGDSAATDYFGIIKERLKINKFAKYLSFKNQRLMQIKNEQFLLLLGHLPWFLPKEIASWIYVILFEKYTWQAIRDLFKQAPLAWQKRKIIMGGKKSGIKEMKKWFR